MRAVTEAPQLDERTKLVLLCMGMAIIADESTIYLGVRRIGTMANISKQNAGFARLIAIEEGFLIPPDSLKHARSAMWKMAIPRPDSKS